MDYFSSAYPLGEFLANDVRGGGASTTTSKDLSQKLFTNKVKNRGNFQPLGINTKSQSKPENTGLPKDTFSRVLSRTQKLILQEIAREILKQMQIRKTKNHPEGYKTFVHRVNYCLNRRIDKNKGVGVRMNEERGTAYFDNLQRCGSVWNCAVCSGEITEVRKIELKQGIDNWRSQGGWVYLVTLTNRHHMGDNLGDLLSGQRKALVKLWGQRAVKEMLKALGYVGRITATEVTWSFDNGWHPHFHLLVFFDHQINIQGLQTFLASEWINACRKAGLKLPSMDIGVDVRDGSYADKYVAKWGLEHELTKGHVKKGRGDSLTPFDMLRQYPENPELFGDLFREFADVFKGKRQLVWTDGLKELLGIDEKSDEEIIFEPEKESILIHELAVEVWDLLVRYSQRAEYLEAIELDYSDGGDRAYELVMRLAKYHAELMVENSNVH